MTTVLTILAGTLVVFGLTALTGYFVAQEFGYMAVDRSRLKARAAVGDSDAKRALGITGRTSFMLSGAQLGITVTGLLVGYVAEPMVGAGIGDLLGGVGVPTGAGVAVGTVLALAFSTVVQMVFGELFPKNLAIARPEPVARRLARSTAVYLRAFGWLIWLFDQSANLLLRLLRIEPVHDVEHAATPRDLQHIAVESRDSGDLPADLWVLVDRVLDFHDSTAEHAMVPRPQVVSVAAEAPLRHAVELMASGHSRLPVLGSDIDDIIGMICLRDVLDLDEAALHAGVVREAARGAVLVPVTASLPSVLGRLREVDEQLACVVDEYGGLAGVITVEDIAEELIGEITDEHDPDSPSHWQAAADGSWLLPGATHIDEVERLLDHDLPPGDYQTISGLVITRLRRLPMPGDTVTVELPRPASALDDQPARHLTLVVQTLDRRVPGTVRLHLDGAPAANGVRQGVDR